MKRITLIILSVAAILAGSVSCQKVNDLDKRLTQLEQTVSDLKAQVLAGAVITSVDKTADGCTFILSNGQSYTVTNGKNGSDGEAIIADVEIEENFIVLTLKDGETLRISYQNPLSMVTLSIVPDYDDGTVGKPETVEAMEMKSHIFYLDISVTPAKYTEILSDTERFIHKAVFSPVQTKSGFGNAVTVSPKSVIYAEDAPVPFLEASFELDDEITSLLLNNNSAYTVSYSIEDKDGVHGAATAFVTISHEKSSEPDVPNDSAEDIIIVNGHKAVKLGGTYWGTENVGAITDVYSRIDNVYGAYYQKIIMLGIDYYPANIAAGSWGTNDDYRWTLPTKNQLNALKNDCYWEWQGNYNGSGMNGYIIYKAKNDADKGKVGGIEGYSTDTDIYIFLPAAGYYNGERPGWSGKGSMCYYWILDNIYIYVYDTKDGKWLIGDANSYGISSIGPVRPVAVPK